MAKSARLPSATQRFWHSLPLRSYLIFLIGVFCLFATFGFLSDIQSGGRSPTRELVLDVLLAGLVALACVAAGTKSAKFFLVAIPLFVFSLARPDAGDAPRSIDQRAADIEARLDTDAAGTAIGVIIAYVCFIVFVATEGRRYLRVQAEIDLARDLHQTIAPRIDQRLDRFEFAGVSMPSSEVGGDLVDVAVIDGRWTAYIADVSGHGVASGTLMAMFKSAARSLLMLKRDPAALLADLNRVIFEVKRSNMFITCALLAYESERSLQFALAGHLPILHYQQASGTITELTVGQLPVGMFEEQTYRTATVSFERGDLFALVTDGVTEVFDARDREFGLDHLKNVLAANARRPLTEIIEAVFCQVRSHGPQMDDQSLMLVRCL